MKGHAEALVGAQFGSEGKGMVAAALAHQYDCHVRTGGPNAGHTYYHDGEKFVGRSIPCGWINPDANLYIGPGAVLDINVFKQELAELQAHDPEIASRLFVDERAVVISLGQHLGEGGVSGNAHRVIGSTGEGVGLARMAKINRDALISTDTAPFACIRVADVAHELADLGVHVANVAHLLYREMEDGHVVLLEGTQGHGLSLTLGPWPYVTSSDTNAAQLASDAGISPSLVRSTILVARTYPIRVAGTSGPLFGETTFEEIGVQPEYTTVTKKMRRVGCWDHHQIQDALEVNHPASLVVTFMDYLFPECKDITNWRALPDDVLVWISRQESVHGCKIIGVGTGPRSYCPIGVQAVSHAG